MTIKSHKWISHEEILKAVADAQSKEVGFAVKPEEVVISPDLNDCTQRKIVATIDVSRYVDFKTSNAASQESAQDKLRRLLLMKGWHGSAVDEFRECLEVSGLHVVEKP